MILVSDRCVSGGKIHSVGMRLSRKGVRSGGASMVDHQHFVRIFPPLPLLPQPLSSLPLPLPLPLPLLRIVFTAIVRW